MRKKRKCLSALCMAGLLGCMVPMSTMEAAEGAETPETVSENDIIESDVLPVQDDLGIAALSEQDAASDSVIQINFGGTDVTKSLSDGMEYKYINNHDQRFEISVSTGSASYYLDNDVSAGIKSEEQLESDGVAGWTELTQNNNSQIVLDRDGQYVLYVKAESDSSTVYVRSVIVVVDTDPPEISGIDDGGAYLEGTVFQVEDANLETVHVNRNSVSPDGNGNYSVTAKSATEPSCEIKAKDKAGNETTISVTVTETVREPGEGNIITQGGAYSLKTGTTYQLGDGNWTVGGDSTVYRGGITFCVAEERIYLFRKL